METIAEYCGNLIAERDNPLSETPWHAGYYGEGGARREVVIDKNGGYVCEVLDRGTRGAVTATMLAAGPDMLEALQAFAVAVWSDCRVPGELRKEWASIYHTMVVPAIRKATGGDR